MLVWNASKAFKQWGATVNLAQIWIDGILPAEQNMFWAELVLTGKKQELTGNRKNNPGKEKHQGKKNTKPGIENTKLGKENRREGKATNREGKTPYLHFWHWWILYKPL